MELGHLILINLHIYIQAIANHLPLVFAILVHLSMGKLVLVFSLVVLGLAVTCKAATYMVGDNSGWDISTDIDTWAQDKTFAVGDVLSKYFTTWLMFYSPEKK